MRYLSQRLLAFPLTASLALCSAPVAQAYIGPGSVWSAEDPILVQVGWCLCLGLGILAFVLWPIAILARILIRS